MYDIIEWIKDKHKITTIIKDLQNKSRYKIDTDGILTYTANQVGPRYVIPPRLKRKYMHAFHNLPTSGHQGVVKTLERLQKRFFWYDMSTDVTDFINGCLTCRLRKDSSSRNGLLQLFSATKPFQMINMDILGPFDVSERGNKYVCVVQDRFSRYRELIAQRDISAKTTADVIHDNIICRHGCFDQLLTDRGTNFKSKLVQRLCDRLGVEKLFSTPYHSATNGSVEVLNRYVLSYLNAYCKEDPTNWDLYLQSCAFSYRTSIVRSIGTTQFSLVHGRQAMLPADIIYSTPEEIERDRIDFQIENSNRLQTAIEHANNWQRKTDRQKKDYFDRNRKNVMFEVGDMVLKKIVVSDPNGPKKIGDRFEGPYEITQKHSDLNYTINNTCKNKFERLHVTNLSQFKAYINDSDDESLMSDSTVVSQESHSEYENSISNSEEIIDQTPPKIDKFIVKDRYSNNGIGIEFLYHFGDNECWLTEEFIPENVLKEYRNRNNVCMFICVFPQDKPTTKNKSPFSDLVPIADDIEISKPNPMISREENPPVISPSDVLSMSPLTSIQEKRKKPKSNPVAKDPVRVVTSKKYPLPSVKTFSRESLEKRVTETSEKVGRQRESIKFLKNARVSILKRLLEVETDNVRLKLLNEKLLNRN